MGNKIYEVAIHPDDYTDPKRPPESDASSPRWARLLEAAGHKVRWVNVYKYDIIEQLRGCDGFMWRWGHFGGMYQIAQRLLPVIERQLGVSVYPDQNTCWHYDDKVAQAYLLEAAGIPIPKTWAWHRRCDALEWARSAKYPFVFKLYGGAGSENVRLLRCFDDAEFWISKLFLEGVYSLQETKMPKWPSVRQRVRSAAKLILTGLPPNPPRAPGDAFSWHHNYAYFQEFLPDNAFDTRITVIGKRAFGFRRFNRVNDFRASGSGKLDYEANSIDPSFVRLAFKTAYGLRMQSCAIDGLYCDGVPVVGEISYTYVSWAVHDCPGHWELDGAPEDGELTWHPGRMWPEEAQIADFIDRLSSRKSR